MESLNYACLWKRWCILGLILIISIAANITSADVSISNSYYTSGGESHENVVLHNMDYSNDASIFGDAYSASSKASTANQSETSKFSDTAYSSSLQGPQAYGFRQKDPMILNIRDIYPVEACYIRVSIIIWRRKQCPEICR